MGEPCACLTTTGSAEALCFCLRSASGAPWPQVLRVPRSSAESEARSRRSGSEERRAALPPSAPLLAGPTPSFPHALLLCAVALSGFVGWKLGRAGAAPPAAPPPSVRRRLQPPAPSSPSPAPPSGSPVDAATLASVLEQAARESEVRAAAAAQAVEEREFVAASVRKERLKREGSPGGDTAFPPPIYPPAGLPPTGLPPTGLPPTTPARKRAVAPAEDNSFRAWEPEAWEAAGFGPTGTPLPPHLVARTPARADAAGPGDAAPPTTGRRRAVRD